MRHCLLQPDIAVALTFSKFVAFAHTIYSIISYAQKLVHFLTRQCLETRCRLMLRGADIAVPATFVELGGIQARIDAHVNAVQGRAMAAGLAPGIVLEALPVNPSASGLVVSASSQTCAA